MVKKYNQAHNLVFALLIFLYFFDVSSESSSKVAGKEQRTEDPVPASFRRVVSSMSYVRFSGCSRSCRKAANLSRKAVDFLRTVLVNVSSLRS